MARTNQPTAEGVALLMPYLNNITGAIEQGMSRAEIWGEVQAAEAEGGPQIAGASIFDMNYVYGRAREVVNAQDAFAGVNPGDALPSEAVAWAPWAAQTGAAWAEPQYLVRFEWEGESGGGAPVGGWFQTDWDGSIDVTKQDVLDRLMGSAQLSLDSGSPPSLSALNLAEGIGVSGIGRVQILRF